MNILYSHNIFYSLFEIYLASSVDKLLDTLKLDRLKIELNIDLGIVDS